MVISITELASYCKRRGIVFPNSEIYGGLAGFYDYGPVGVEISKNIKNEWWKSFVQQNDNVVGISGSIISNPKVWEASGHVENFIDMLVECKKCKVKSRADHLIEDKLKINAEGMKPEELDKLIEEHKIKCPSCKGNLNEVVRFNPMFITDIGPAGESQSYLRPETAQLIFSQFKNILETTRQKLPFGVAQIGKAFRNEISPRNFLFRLREFEQMELEFFTHPERKDESQEFDAIKKLKVSILTAKSQKNKKPKQEKMTIEDLYKKKIVKSKWHAYWVGHHHKWYTDLGIDPEHIRLREHRSDELSHYSSATIDIEFNFVFGWKEIAGIADRGDFDLKQHSHKSRTELGYYDEKTKEKVIPHVVAEPSTGVERAFLAFLVDAYTEEVVKGEKRIVLKLHPRLAPYKVAVFPLVKKQNMDKMAKEIHNELKRYFTCFYDESGSIGRRYRRMDEIGTPFCITIDGQSLEDGTATVRDRDSLKQIRVPIKQIKEYVEKLIEA